MDAVVVVEILNRRDHVQSRQRISLHEGKRSFTIGRGAGCDVIVDDPYAAPIHVLVEVAEDGRVALTDQASVNGIWLHGQRIHGAQSARLAGSDFRIGHTRIRVRTPNQTLAPERADGSAATESSLPYGKLVAIGVLACVALLGYSSWLDAPRDIAATVASTLLGLVVVSGIWIGIWTLLSRIMLLEWRWLTHGAILLCSTAVVLIAESMFDIGLFALDVRSPGWVKFVLGTIAAGGLLYLHLVNASPMSRRVAGLFAFLIPALAFGTANWVEARKQRRDVNYIDMSQEVFPPYLRVRAAKPLDGFFESMAKLKDGAGEKRRIAISEGEDEEMIAEE